MPTHIMECYATGEEIEGIITERLLPAIHDLERTKVLLALMTLFFTLMKPTITAEEVVEGIQGASQWICLYLSELDMTEDEKLILN